MDKYIKLTLEELENLIENDLIPDEDLDTVIELCEERVGHIGFSTFIDYNIIDVVRVEQIDSVVKYLDAVFSIAYVAKSTYDDTYATIRTWDVMIHNLLFDRGIVVPFEVSNRKEKIIAGGYVKDPQIDKFDYLMSFDFKSLYPSLCMTFNISPETYMGKFGPIYGSLSVEKILNGDLEEYIQTFVDNNVSITGKGTVFSNESFGFVPELMAMGFNERTKFSKMEDEYTKKLAEMPDKESTEAKELENAITNYAGKSMAFKILINSLYGALSNEFMRWYSDDVAESITLSGQMAVKWVEKYVNAWMNKILETSDVDYIIAIDTDSCYINMVEIVRKMFGDDYKDVEEDKIITMLEKFAVKVQETIASALEELYRQTNSYDKKLFMNLEAIGSAIWIAKKRYVMSVPSFKMVRFDPPKLKIQGIEAVRSSTPLVCRNIIKKAIPIILKGNIAEIKEYVEGFREKFYTLPFSEVAFPRGVSDIEKFMGRGDELYISGTPIQNKASIIYNDQIKKRGLQNSLPLIQSGGKLRFVYLKKPNPLMEDVFGVPDELPEEFKDIVEFIDYDTQFDKTFYVPINRILEAAKLKISYDIDMEQFFV